MKIRLANPLQVDSIVDGEGLRAVLWTQGCSHKCPGCHNPNTHPFKGGYLEDIDNIFKEIDSFEIQSGITFSGGDPMFQVDACLEIAKYARSKGLNVWVYTGYTFEELLVISKSNNKYLEFLKNIDVLIDGKFELENKDLSLKFRGSTNQRILNVRRSLRLGRASRIIKYDVKKEKIKKDYIFV